MTTVKEYLTTNGWNYAGKCKVCGGRADEFHKGRAVIKVRLDQYGNELPDGRLMITGVSQDGKRITPTRAYKTNIEIVLQNLNA